MTVSSSMSARNCSEQPWGWAVVGWRSPSAGAGGALLQPHTVLSAVVVLQGECIDGPTGSLSVSFANSTPFHSTRKTEQQADLKRKPLGSEGTSTCVMHCIALCQAFSPAQHCCSLADHLCVGVSCVLTLLLPQVRLLTGIGRYNEMTYIFELLHEKHYFEVLMRKKLDPVGGGK